MQLTIIGASAGVGLLTVQEALRRGHEVTAMARHLEGLADHASLRKVTGSATDVAAVREAVDGAEVVLVTLGTGKSSKATTLYSDAARVLLEVLGAQATKPPLLVLTGFGAGESGRYNTPMMRLLFRLFLEEVYADKTRMERMIGEAYPKSEFVRPGRLTDRAATRAYRVVLGLSKGIRIGPIARADVADYLVTEAEQRKYLGKSPALTG